MKNQLGPTVGPTAVNNCKQQTLFPCDIAEPRKFKDYVEINDIKGAMTYLRGLSRDDMTLEVLLAGFSLIGFKQGTQSVLNHIAYQLNKNQKQADSSF